MVVSLWLNSLQGNFFELISLQGELFLLNFLQGDLFLADLYTGYLFPVDLLNSLQGDCSIRMTALLQYLDLTLANTKLDFML